MTRLLDAKAPLQAINQLARHKSLPMTKRCYHGNEEHYREAIAALDDTGKAEALAAARWKQTE